MCMSMVHARCCFSNCIGGGTTAPALGKVLLMPLLGSLILHPCVSNTVHTVLAMLLHTTDVHTVSCMRSG
jgi:hypothetical protein